MCISNNVLSFTFSAQQMTKDFRPDVGEQKYSFEDVQGVSC